MKLRKRRYPSIATMRHIRHFILQPKYSIPKKAILTAGIASNTTRSIEIEIRLLTSQSLLIVGFATCANAIKYRLRKQESIAKSTIPKHTRFRELLLVLYSNS